MASNLSAAAPSFKKKRSRGNSATILSTNGSDAGKSQPLKGINIGNKDDDEGEEKCLSAGASTVHKVRKLDVSSPLISSTGIPLAKQRAKARASKKNKMILKKRMNTLLFLLELNLDHQILSRTD
ncbi:unnamed protein product [Sympodiomycopsis kandeliae]